MIIHGFKKVFWVLASAMLLSAVSVGQTPPTDQRSLPQAPQPRQLSLSLVVDFKLNGGAASTKERIVTLNFTVREKTGPGNFAPNDVTASVTQYRVLESDNPNVDLSGQPWIQMPTRSLQFELALHDKSGQRYGERRVALQVKTASLESNVVSDTIALEPVLKEYRVSGSNSALQPNPLLKYAADQGFKFPLEYFETCNGDCSPVGKPDPSLASGTSSVPTQALSKGGAPHDILTCVLVSVATLGVAAPFVCSPPAAPVAAGTCTTKADYLLFEDRSLNQFWNIKSVAVAGASVHPHGVNRFRLKSTLSISDGSCLPGYQIIVGDIVVEGPEVDDFVDPANPWKNAFVRPQSLTRPPPTQTVVRPPN